MEQDLKDVLLKDLCARLPYGVKCCIKGNYKISGDLVGIVGENISLFSSGCGTFNINVIRPYLFPLSSMSDEQKEKYCSLQQKVIYNSKGLINSDVMEYVNWCYKNHIDIDSIIPMGLAVDCTNLKIY